jgi:hypothetical protein
VGELTDQALVWRWVLYRAREDAGLDDPYWIRQHRRHCARFRCREQVLGRRRLVSRIGALHLFLDEVVAAGGY